MKSSLRRKGITLLETLLVVAVLVVIAAIAYPSLRAMSGSYKMTGAVDSVRAAWARARARAMEEGRPYRFSVEPAGSHFRIAPDKDDFWQGSAGSGGGDGLVLENSLPDGVRFSLDGDAGSPPPASTGVGLQSSTPATSAESYSTAVVFLPDGTARSDVKILFQVKGERPTEVQLKGLTGASSVSRGQ